MVEREKVRSCNIEVQYPRVENTLVSVRKRGYHANFNIQICTRVEETEKIVSEWKKPILMYSRMLQSLKTL